MHTSHLSKATGGISVSATSNHSYTRFLNSSMADEDFDEPCPGDCCEHILDDHELYDCASCLEADTWALCLLCQGEERWCRPCNCEDGAMPLLLVPDTDDDTNTESQVIFKVTTLKNRPSSSLREFGNLRCSTSAHHKKMQSTHAKPKLVCERSRQTTTKK